MPKESKLSFIEGLLVSRRPASDGPKVFDWDKAALNIKQHLAKYPQLTAEAGLQGDWDYTGGVIFEEGHPVDDSYTYLASNWATPTLILFTGEEEILEIPCFTQDKNTRFHEGSKWDDKSLAVLST